jgi:hypothetical protein
MCSSPGKAAIMKSSAAKSSWSRLSMQLAAHAGNFFEELIASFHDLIYSTESSLKWRAKARSNGNQMPGNPV